MQEQNDSELLERYAEGNSEEAFAELVARYVNLVFSTALRHVGNTQHAEEITQAVFIILARKAHSLRGRPILSGWLYHTARMTAANFARAEKRRLRREQEAYMQSVFNAPEPGLWMQIAPMLDGAMAGLSGKDREAIVLRFFDGRKLSEVGAALGTSEETARKRVNAAVEKLRSYFTRRGIVLSAAGLAAAIGANSVHAAPAGLAAASITAAAGKGMAASGSTLFLIKATLNKMLWMKLKTFIATGAAVLLAAGIATVVVGKVHSSSLIEDAFKNADAPSLAKAPAVFVLRPTRYPGSLHEAHSRERYLGRNILLPWLLSIAYDYPWWDRVVLPADAPQERYDLLLTLTDNSREMLRREIHRQLGLVARRESRMTDVLVLEMDPAQVARLKTTEGGGGTASPPDWRSAVRRLAFTNQPVSIVAQTLGRQLGRPVFDRTGLSGNYDLMLQWPGQNDGNSEEQAVRQTVADQLGLRLISSEEMADLLVVEKAGK